MHFLSDTSPAHLFHLDLITRKKMCSVQVLKLLIMKSSPVSRHFLLDPKILLSTLLLNTLKLCSSLGMKHRVLHPYKTTGKIIGLDFLSLSF
jgi:hypothetical protein